MKSIKQLFSRRHPYDDLSGEIRTHLEEKVDALVAGGMSSKEAEYAARREFGNVTLVEEDGREVWRWRTVEQLFRNVRLGFRISAKNPGFAAVVILTLALGIGA